MSRTNFRTSEVFGFIGYLTTCLLFAVFLLWTFLPEVYLRRIGIHYLPNKYYAIALPTLVCVGICCLMIGYQGMNHRLVNPRSSYQTIEDKYSRHLSVEVKRAHQLEASKQRVRKFSDIGFLNSPLRDQKEIEDGADQHWSSDFKLRSKKNVVYSMDERIDQIVDLPVPVVNKVLFEGEESEEEEEYFSEFLRHGVNL